MTTRYFILDKIKEKLFGKSVAQSEKYVVGLEKSRKKAPFPEKGDGAYDCNSFRYFLSKLSQQVQLSASQLHVLPTWILRRVQ